jgi:hypothetical protein
MKETDINRLKPGERVKRKFDPLSRYIKQPQNIKGIENEKENS